MMSYYTLKLLAEAHQADLLRQAQPRTVAPRRNLWRPILRIGRSTESPKRGLPLVAGAAINGANTLGLTAAGASAESGTPVSLTTALALSPNQEGTR